KAEDRVRALDLMQLFGPQPSTPLLLDLVQETEPAVRARAVSLLGIHRQSDQPTDIASDVRDRLIELLHDPEPRIRRLVCEAILRGGFDVPPDPLIPLLDDEDRFVRFAARRALEHLPPESWRDPVMNTPRTRLFLTGAVGLLIVAPDEAMAVQILQRCIRMIRGDVHDPRYPQGFLSDSDYSDLLRVAQLALIRGNIGPPPHPGIGRPLTESEQTAMELAREMLLEYPTTDAPLNRELVRLLVYLQVPEAAPLFAKQLALSELPFEEKLHIAAYASRLTTGWDPVSKLAMIEFLDTARSQQGGHSLAAYVEQFSRQFLKTLTTDEQLQILAAAADWPQTALSMLAGLPVDPGSAMLARLRELDAELTKLSGDPIDRLRVGIVAVLSRSGDEASLAYLRSVYQNDPNRRATVAMGLTLHPNDANWPILVDSLKIVEGPVASEILATLLKVDRSPQDAGTYRRLILLGLRSHEPIARGVVKLLEHWTGQIFAKDSTSIQDELALWQQWYASQFPEAPPATLPTAASNAKWSYAELFAFLQTDIGLAGDPALGSAVFQKVQCAQCHRHGNLGEAIGPDLTAVAKRLHTKEILESLVYPSHNLAQEDGIHPIAARDQDGPGPLARKELTSTLVQRQENAGERNPKKNLPERGPDNQSPMPSGLVDLLSLNEVADLFAFLRRQPELVESNASIEPGTSLQR
ncbi:MAG: HEAT repeat domain-containing protein, partial [Pirellulales bacterium]|nr:HEAT repeat domain-containing protein [Pirellulales bacterium]